VRILLTNDDGVHAEGIEHLAAALAELGEIVVVAPDREQSASGHALTLDRPLRMRPLREHWYAVDGTPSDCVHLGIRGLLRTTPPDLVVSGINLGLNLGDDVTYSGTVSATFEAHLHRLPAVAFSQEMEEGYSLQAAAAWARDFLAVLAGTALTPETLINVNFPATAALREMRLTRLGHRVYHQTVVEKVDPKGREYFWIAGTPEWIHENGTDHAALAAGYVSVTPLHLDLTDYPGLDRYAPLCEEFNHLHGDALVGVGRGNDGESRGQGSL